MEMDRARKRAKEGGHFGELKAIEMLAEQTDALKNKMGVEATDDSLKYAWVSTGSGEAHQATLKAVIDTRKAWLDSAGPDSGLVGLVLDKTAFYAEAGGQVCDVGTLTAGGAVFTVNDATTFAENL